MVPAGQPSQIVIDQEACLASLALMHIDLALAVVVTEHDEPIGLAAVKAEIHSSAEAEVAKALP